MGVTHSTQTRKTGVRGPLTLRPHVGQCWKDTPPPEHHLLCHVTGFFHHVAPLEEKASLKAQFKRF